MKILGIIPARCGSKSIKNKNIVDLCGKPLIAHSIDHGNFLKEQGLIDRVIVSTDCKKIKDIALQFNGEVPFIRPEKISQDHSKSIEYILHALDFYKQNSIYFDAVLLLQPTSPIRPKEILTEAITKFIKGKSPSLISVYKEIYINKNVMYYINSKDELIPVSSSHNLGTRKEEHKPIYIRNGAIYITRTSYLKRFKRIISSNPAYVLMNKLDSVNIDSIEDLELAKKLLC